MHLKQRNHIYVFWKHKSFLEIKIKKKNNLYFRLVSGYICIKVNKLQSTVGYDLSAVSDISAS